MTELVNESQAISSLLPHSGAMCLLERVEAWDEITIECRAISHRDPANPLRHQGQLPVQAGIEYLAQAMAIHGTLCEQRVGRPRMGYLAVLSRVDWYCSRLDDLPGELTVIAEKQAVSGGGYSYYFRLYHGQRLLLEGQAVVALQDNER